MNRRVNLARYTVPEYDGPLGKRDPHADLLVQMLRNDERREDRKATEEASLSLRMAACYGRDVLCMAMLEPMQVIVKMEDGSKKVVRGVPSRRFILNDPFLSVAVSVPMAKHILNRDEGHG